MDNLYYQLEALNYAHSFCKKYDIRPIHKAYFTYNNQNSNNNNSNEPLQFHTFVSLWHWLLQQILASLSASSSGPKLEKPNQFEDDPNSVLATLIEATKPILRGTGTNSADLLSPLKLRLAYGEPIVNLLSCLASMALRAKGILSTGEATSSSIGTLQESPASNSTAAATIVVEDTSDQSVLMGYQNNNNNNNGIDDDYIDNNEGGYSDNDENNRADPILKHVYQQNNANSAAVLGDGVKKNAHPHYYHVDPEEWRLEVERVTPLLKVSIQNDHKDWRLHLQQMEMNQKEIIQLEMNASPLLERVQNDIEKTIEKIASRERYLNQQLEPSMEEYRKSSNTLSSVKVAYQSNLAVQSALANELASVSEQLDTVKASIDELGSGMNDAKPIVQIKSAMSQLKNEMKQIDLRTGVVQHRLYHARMTDKADNLIKMGGGDKGNLVKI